ncbi:MAG: anaerobic ribonucleoside-triphosphate reductase activating protein [Treponema sp.]
MLYAGLLKTSLVNFPGHIAAVVFLPGCNMRCPYCYNAELAQASAVQGLHNNRYLPITEICAHIKKRSAVLDGVVISGGEALLSPALPTIIEAAKESELAVKLDTNGLLPEKLAALLNNPQLCPNMVAVDIKTRLENYGQLLSNISGGTAAAHALKKTIALLTNTTDSRLQVEYRTVLVPPLVQKADIQAIAAELPHSAQWFFSPFIPSGCLNPAWNAVQPYTKQQMQELTTLAQQYIPHAALRM